MSRPISLPRLKPLFDHFEPGDDTWPQRVQAIADQLYALLQRPDDLTEGQFTALASLTESVTLATFTGSTLNRLLDAGNYAMAFYEFQKWVYGPDPVTGQPVVLPALVQRRAAEQALFVS